MRRIKTERERAARTGGTIRGSAQFGAFIAIMLASTGMLAAGESPGSQPHPRKVTPDKGAALIMEINPREWLYQKLPSEKEIPELRPLIDLWEAAPKTTTLRRTSIAGSKPVRIAIHQVGPGTNGHVYVLIHGMLASYKTWRYVAAALPADADLWIIDLPGHGESDKPSPESLGPSGFAPGAVAERIFQALEQEIAARPSAPRITLVAHSLGGLMVLRMLSCPGLRQRHASCLAQVDDAVLFAPCDIAVGVQLGQLLTIVELSSTKVSIGDALGVVHERVALASTESCYRAGYATRESTDLLFEAFTTPAILGASQAMIKQAVPGWATTQRPDWSKIRPLECNYTNITVPCLIVWGECDETLPEWMGHKLRDHIPGAQLRELPECMHSAHLEYPTLCAEFITAFHAEHQMVVGTVGSSPVDILSRHDTKVVDAH
jgi:pimeloyl-ACP methyl ester carboxylesterase